MLAKEPGSARDLREDLLRLGGGLDEDVTGPHLVVHRDVLLVQRLQGGGRDRRARDERVGELVVERQVAHERAQVGLRDAALGRLGLELLLPAELAGELGETGVDLAVGDRDALARGGGGEQVAGDHPREHLPLEGRPVGAELLRRLRVGEPAVDDALQRGRGDPLLPDRRGGAGADRAARRRAAARSPSGSARSRGGRRVRFTCAGPLGGTDGGRDRACHVGSACGGGDGGRRPHRVAEDGVEQAGGPVEQGGVAQRLAADARGHRLGNQHRADGGLDHRALVEPLQPHLLALAQLQGREADVRRPAASPR